MIGELITLPLRIGVRATRLWVRATGEALAIAANATGQLIDAATSRGSASFGPGARDRAQLTGGATGYATPAAVHATSPAPPTARPAPEPSRTAPWAVTPVTEATVTAAPVTEATVSEAPATEPPAIRPRPVEPSEALPSEPPARVLRSEPTHVSEEPELVAEFAEPGAEEGAGAELHVEEPWPGYRGMNAKQVIARLAGASTAELAAVQLYESGNRCRSTILAAVEREMRSANGGGPPS